MDRLEIFYQYNIVSSTTLIHLTPSHLLILYPREPLLQIDDLSAREISSVTPNARALWSSKGGGRRREEENKIKRFTLMWLWWPEQRQSQWKWGLGRRLSRAWNHETLNTFIICLYVVVAHPPASTWNLNWTFISFCPLIDDSYRINGVSRTFSYFLAFLIVPHNLILNIKFQISFNCPSFLLKKHVPVQGITLHWYFMMRKTFIN